MNKLWKIFVVVATVAVAAVLASNAYAATARPMPQPACVPADTTGAIKRLEERYGETLQGTQTLDVGGRAMEVEVYASDEKATYSIIARDPQNPDASCMIGFGVDWKPGDVVELYHADQPA